MIGPLFGITALIPAMLNLTVLTAGQTLSVRICTGDGTSHVIQLPVDGGSQKGPKGLCCAKGCHGGNQRKRTPPKFAPAQ